MASKNTTAADWAKKGFAQINGGTYQQISKVSGRKTAAVKKLPVLMPGDMPKPNTKEGEDFESGGKIYIKPLSVNDAWKGQRFKSDEYKDYDFALSFLLPKNIVIPDGKLTINFEWGLSNDAGDWDGPVKQAQDIISRRYGFNDKRIVRGVVEKVIVPKGDEYISFKIEKYVKEQN